MARAEGAKQVHPEGKLHPRLSVLGLGAKPWQVSRQWQGQASPGVPSRACCLQWIMRLWYLRLGVQRVRRQFGEHRSLKAESLQGNQNPFPFCGRLTSASRSHLEEVTGYTHPRSPRHLTLVCNPSLPPIISFIAEPVAEE